MDLFTFRWVSQLKNQGRKTMQKWGHNILGSKMYQNMQDEMSKLIHKDNKRKCITMDQTPKCSILKVTEQEKANILTVSCRKPDTNIDDCRLIRIITWDTYYIHVFEVLLQVVQDILHTFGDHVHPHSISRTATESDVKVPPSKGTVDIL